MEERQKDLENIVREKGKVKTIGETQLKVTREARGEEINNKMRNEGRKKRAPLPEIPIWTRCKTNIITDKEEEDLTRNTKRDEMRRDASVSNRGEKL